MAFITATSSKNTDCSRPDLMLMFTVPGTSVSEEFSLSTVNVLLVVLLIVKFLFSEIFSSKSRVTIASFNKP